MLEVRIPWYILVQLNHVDDDVDGVEFTEARRLRLGGLVRVNTLRDREDALREALRGAATEAEEAVIASNIGAVCAEIAALVAELDATY